ncbi:MAG: protease pro-enzyme activation domain-containing protein [Fimbriimonas sp.]|nr:protease pro-enzyme activation domain-containing protein [Fimbriimonas sp.]
MIDRVGTYKPQWMRRLCLLAVLSSTVWGSPAALAQSSKLVQLPLPVPDVIQRSQMLGHKAANEIVHVNISLLPPNPAALQAFADSVNDPSSPNYGKFATPAQLGKLFGAPQSFVDKVVSYLRANGFKVTLVADSRLNIMADASVAAVEKAFDTTINNYRVLNPAEPTRTVYYANSEPIEFPANLAPSVLLVSGLDNTLKPKPAHRKLALTGKGRFGATPLTPDQTRTVYDTAPIYAAGMQGLGRHVAISNWDGYRLTNVQLYYKQFNLPTPAGGLLSNITEVSIDGGSGSGSPGAEGDLDIQMELGMAPLASMLIYSGGDLLNLLTREQNDNLADVISESWLWGLPTTYAQAVHNVHVLMSAQGQTYMAASGDWGTSFNGYTYSGVEPEVLKVGGTIADVDAKGNRLSEVGWSGSGGGWTTDGLPFNVLPSWQTGKGVPTKINYRLVPDVALNSAGDTTGAYQFFLNGSLSFGYVGTSFASPVFAGCLTITEQKLISLGGNKRLGRISSLFYPLNGRSDVWFDVVQGANGTLPNGTTSNAGPYWDFVTGWGAIDFAAFAKVVATTAPQYLNVSTIAAYDNKALTPAVLEGVNPAGGPSNLAAADGKTFNLGSVLEKQIGAITTMLATFNTKLVPSKVASLSLSAAGSAPAASTVMVYVLNQTTNQFVLLQSISGTAFGTPTSYPVNTKTFSNFVNPSGQVQAIVRCLVPNSRLSQVGAFTFKLDQLQLVATSTLSN